MLHSDALRQLLLLSTTAIFIGFVTWALVHPESLAKVLGYQLSPPNGPGEIGATYAGVFSGQALLCLLAVNRLNDPVIGDLVALFLLLQPVGRLVPLFKHGAPTGVLRLLFALEVFGGIVLLLVRPEI